MNTNIMIKDKFGHFWNDKHKCFNDISETVFPSLAKLPIDIVLPVCGTVLTQYGDGRYYSNNLDNGPYAWVVEA